MGLLDGIKKTASNAINTVQNAAESAVNTVQKTTESAVNTVQKTAESAVNTVQKTADAAVNTVQRTANEARDTLISTAETARQRIGQTASQTAQQVQQAVTHPFETVNRAADRLGGEVRQAGRLLEQGGKQLQGIVPFADEIKQLGQGAQTLGRGIQDAPEAAADGASQVAKTVDNLGQQALSLYDRARQAVEQGVHKGQQIAEQGLDLVRQGTESVINAGKNFVSDVATSVDYKKQIDQLGDGDKYTLGLGASGSIEGLKGYGKGAIEVERKGNQYVVSVDGELGGGLYGEIGGKLGPLKASGEAEALIGAGGKIEMTFNSPEEAKRATEILLRQAGAAGAGALANNLPVIGPAAGLVANQALSPSAQDMQFLAQHTSALEVRGNAAAGIAGSLGVADKSTRLAGLFGGANVKDELTARIEFGNNGQPPGIILKHELSGQVQLGGGIGLNQTGGNKDGAATGLGVGVNATGKITHEQRFDLPASVDTQALLRDPLGTVGNLSQQIGKSRQDKLSLTLEAEADAVGNDAGFRAQLDFSGKPDNIIQSGALQQALQGDFGGALQRVGDNVQVDAKITPYRSHGIALNPGISLMGFGLGVEGKAIRQDFADKPLWEYHGTASQAAADVQPHLQRAIDFIRENPEVLLASQAQMRFPMRG